MQKNHHIRRHVQKKDKQANCLIEWTHNSSVTIKCKRVSLKKHALQSKYDPVGMNNVTMLDFQMVLLANSLLKSVQIHQKIIY